MKELDIVFTKSRRKMPIFSWLIRFWTNKPYSHVSRAVEISDWGKRYFQASEGKVNYEYEKYFLKKHEIVKKYTLLITPELDKKIKEECYREAGNNYGLMQNLGVVLVDICNFFGKKIDNPWKSGRNCSELIYLTVLKQLIPDLEYHPDTVKPHHIEKIIIENFVQTGQVWELL